MGAGERWKARRESLGLSLEEASADLRISGKYLRGIEEGNFEGFPARVFAIGFIKSYAAFLGEDAEPLIEEYGARGGEPPPPDPAQHVAVSSHWAERARRRGNRMAWYILAALAVLLAGTLLSWYSSSSVRIPAPPPPTSATPAPSAAAVPAPVAAPAVAGNAALPEHPGRDNAAAAPAAPAVPPPAPDNGALRAGTDDDPPFQLFLEAREQTWVMYSRDDAEPVDAMLYPGEKISVQAARKIVLKLGNAGGVTGTLNGRRLPSFGNRGQVRSLTLGK
jgi:cytoskeleton protein RodZ